MIVKCQNCSVIGVPSLMASPGEILSPRAAAARTSGLALRRAGASERNEASLVARPPLAGQISLGVRAALTADRSLPWPHFDLSISLRVGSVGRSPRETPRRASRRRASRTPFDPEGARAGGEEPMSILSRGYPPRRRRSETYRQHRSSRAAVVRPSEICPALSSDRRSEWRSASQRAGSHP